MDVNSTSAGAGVRTAKATPPLMGPCTVAPRDSEKLVCSAVRLAAVICWLADATAAWPKLAALPAKKAEAEAALAPGARRRSRRLKVGAETATVASRRRRCVGMLAASRMKLSALRPSVTVGGGATARTASHAARTEARAMRAPSAALGTPVKASEKPIIGGALALP